MPGRGVRTCLAGRRIAGHTNKPNQPWGAVNTSCHEGTPMSVCLPAPTCCRSGTLLVLQADAAVRLSGERWRGRVHKRKERPAVHVQPAPAAPARLRHPGCTALTRVYGCRRALCAVEPPGPAGGGAVHAGCAAACWASGADVLRVSLGRMGWWCLRCDYVCFEEGEDVGGGGCVVIVCVVERGRGAQS